MIFHITSPFWPTIKSNYLNFKYSVYKRIINSYVKLGAGHSGDGDSD
jgi:hypothetical protein